jgi:hypothetical protein
MWVALTKLKFKPSTFLQIPKQTQTQNVTPSKGQFLNFLEMIGRSIRFGVRKWVGWGIRNKHTNVKFFLYLPSSSQDLNVIVMSRNFFEKLPLFLKRKHPHRNKKKKQEIMKKYSIIITFLAFSLAPRTLTSTGGPFRDSLCII